MRAKSVVRVVIVLLFVGTVDLRIVLEENGYKNILVAISEDIPEPEDGGIGMVEALQKLLTETSTVLHRATDNKVYFKDVTILIPSKWGINAPITTQTSFQQADIRLTAGSTSDPTSSLPYTLHSGKCGVAGNFITIPINYLPASDSNMIVEAKGMVQQWAQLRYGVFEEHGYPNDNLLPYFYRHPVGYDAITSSNDTAINGILQSTSGGDCQVDENTGLISNQGDCRFVPDTTGQTATTSLMGFHWLDSVVGFSNEVNHDRMPPHRQNRLCGSRSSSEIIFNLPDFENVISNPSQDTTPAFYRLKNYMYPVVYLAIDKSMPTSTANAAEQGQNIFKGGMRNLFNNYLSNYPDLLVAWSTFEDMDSGANNYLIEEIAPKRIGDGTGEFITKIDDFVPSADVETRDVSAVIRDAELRLRKYKDVGGSILYIVTSTNSTTKDTVVETELAERLLLNNIKLMVGESGPDILTKGLSRFSTLSQASYYFQTSWGSTLFFNQISREIDSLCQNRLKSERRTVFSKKSSISNSQPWTGSFSIDDSIGNNTVIVIRSPIESSYAITLTTPSGDELDLEDDPEVTNWNSPDSNIGIISKRIPDLADSGRWSFTVGCTSCEGQSEIHLQIGSSIRSATSSLPKCQSWVSLTASGTELDDEFVDISQHPAVIQTKFDSVQGRLGDLAVTAQLVHESGVIDSIILSDSGTLDSDISKDGIYSGIFYPEMDGLYTVNIYASDSGSALKNYNNRLIGTDQDSYCCGSSLPTAVLNYFQITVNEALNFEVINTATPSQEPSNFVTDIESDSYGIDGGLVYVALKWTVPFDTNTQVVKYSEDYDQLFDDFDTAPEATVVYGTLEDVELGASVFVYVSAPYNPGKNVYFTVETIGRNNIKTRSYIVWTEPNPPDYVFTSPPPPGESTTTQSTTSSSSTTIPSTETTSTTLQSTTDLATDVTSPSTASTSPGESTSSSTIKSTSAEPATDVTSPSSAASTSTSELTSSFTESSTIPPTTDPATDSTAQSTSTIVTQTSTNPPTDATSSSADSTSTIPTTSITDPVTDSTSPSTESTSTSTLQSSSTITDPTTTDPTTSSSTELTSTTSSSTTTSTTTEMTSTAQTSTDPTTSSSTEPTTTSTSTTEMTSTAQTTTNPVTNPTSSSTEFTSTTDSMSSTTMDSSSTTEYATDSTPTDSTNSSSESPLTTTQDPGNGGDEDPGTPIGYIVGGVVLGLLVVAGVTGGIIFYKRKKQSGNSSGAINSQGSSYYGSGGERAAAVAPTPQYSTSPTYPTPSASEPKSYPAAQSYYDNIGVTIEDDDMMMTEL